MASFVTAMSPLHKDYMYETSLLNIGEQKLMRQQNNNF